MNIIYSVIFDTEYEALETKALKALKMPLFLGFLKSIRRKTIRRKTIRIYRIK